MKIALTGASGYIGSHLRRALTSAGHDVSCQDRNPPSPFLFDLADADQISRWLTAEQPDLVVHLAARTGRLFGEDDRRDACRSNAEATVNVAAACGDLGIRLVYASSSEVYGDTGQVCTEDGPYALPHNLYGLSKRWGEEACQLYAPTGLTIWRISMPYGPGSRLGLRGFNALHTFLFKAYHRLPIDVHHGSSRSWTWIGDTTAAMLATLERPGVWNIGGDSDHRPMIEVAEMACDITGAPRDLIQLIRAPRAQTLVKRLSSAKLESIGWVPTMPLESGMKATYEWVAQHDMDGRRVGKTNR